MSAYSLERARGPGAKIAGRLFRAFGIPRNPPDDLARIAVPTTLIWGRHDRANRLRIAPDASARHGWLLHVMRTVPMTRLATMAASSFLDNRMFSRRSWRAWSCNRE